LRQRLTEDVAVGVIGLSGADEDAAAMFRLGTEITYVVAESFTITELNDIKFLDYFLDRCTAEDEPGLISRIFRWMAQPI
jgi:hypothetical protein